MKWFVSLVLIFMMAVFISACGSSGSTGNGNTVFITGSTKTATPLIAFAHISSNGAFVADQLSFTIKSTPYNSTGTVKNSDVNINKVTFKYTPVSQGAPAFAPVVTFKDYGVSLTPGGTA